MRSRKNRSLTNYCVTQIDGAKLSFSGEKAVFIYR